MPLSRSYLTFRGVPVSGREKADVLRSIVVRMGQVLKVALDGERLMNVFRVQQRPGVHRDPMLIVRFGSAGVRHAFFTAYFARKTLSTLDQRGPAHLCVRKPYATKFDPARQGDGAKKGRANRECFHT